MLIILLGPTAIGKTNLAIELAKHYNTEIISADSRQFYTQLNIGSAKPTDEQLTVTTHHFINNLSIEDYYNVARFETDVLKLLDNLFKKHSKVIMTGGSGLYIQTVCNGIDDFPDADNEIRNELIKTYNEKGIDELLQILTKLDPASLKTVDKNNSKRLIRAIEVCIATGKPYSELKTNTSKTRNFNIVKIGLNQNKDILNERINKRVDQMIEAGLIEEARSLYNFKHLNALNTVGYKELFDYFDNKITLEQAITNIKTNTRRYAKKQITWFKKDKTIKWFEPDDKDKIIDYINNNNI